MTKLKLNKLTEGLVIGDLVRMVHNEIHIDEFKSKLGDDKDICVITFKVKEREPATDLVDFLEKGYSFVLDADISSGEMDDGSYIVFTEIARDKDFPENFCKIVSDINNLTETEMDFWRWQYYGEYDYHEVTESEVAKLVPLDEATYTEYMSQFNKDENESVDEKQVDESLDKMRMQAGVHIHKKAPSNEYTNKLRELAGIR